MDFLERIIDLAMKNVEKGGRPFACIIVKDGKIISEQTNQVVQTNDPTAHAEICAIRDATKKLKTEHLSGCEIYILAEPCPMCLGALYYCSPDKVHFIVTRDDYKVYYEDERKYFSFSGFYKEFCKPFDKRNLPMIYHPNEKGLDVYKKWQKLK